MRICREMHDASSVQNQIVALLVPIRLKGGWNPCIQYIKIGGVELLTRAECLRCTHLTCRAAELLNDSAGL